MYLSDLDPCYFYLHQLAVKQHLDQFTRFCSDTTAAMISHAKGLHAIYQSMK